MSVFLCLASSISLQVSEIGQKQNCHARKVHLQRMNPINGSNSKKEADTHFVECQSMGRYSRPFTNDY